MNFKTIDDLKDTKNRRVLVRVDINVPMDGGFVGSLFPMFEKKNGI